MINISPSALKAYLECPRSWWLQYVARAPKVIPSYVTAGRRLDAAVQTYLHGPPGADGPDLDDTTRAELAVLRAELPAPGTVLVQHRPPSQPCPGLEDRVRITTGGLDYMTPPNAALMVIGDLKRVWHADAAHTTETLADDVQSQMYAWLVWQTHAPIEIIWRWTYCVRGTESGTRKPKAFSVDVKADRARVDAWFERVLLPAARGMLKIVGPVEGIEHDPDSCENGNRCFVRASCPLHTGPVKGEIMVDLSRFKTNAAKAAEASVTEAETPTYDLRAPQFDIEGKNARIAINPPALAGNRVCDIGLNNVAQIVPAESVITLDTPSPMLDVQTLEGPGAELFEIIDEPVQPGWRPPSEDAQVIGTAEVVSETEPSPPPAEDKPVRKRTRRTESGTVSADEWRATEQARADFEAECARVNAELESLRGQLEFTVEGATTEALRDELIDRGWRVWLEARS